MNYNIHKTISQAHSHKMAHIAMNKYNDSIELTYPQTNDNTVNTSDKHYNIKDFVNGAISGAFGVTISHPIDTAKTCLQNKKPIPPSVNALYRGIIPAVYGVGFEKAIVFGTYNNTYKFLQKNNINNDLLNPISGALSGLTASLVVTPTERLKILSQSGKDIKVSDLKLSNLYRGISATFTRETPGFAIYFTVYNFLKDNYIKQYNELPLHKSFIYGGVAGAVSWFGIYPQDVVKTRMQTYTGNDKLTFVKTARTLYQMDGIRGFFRGFHFALMRAIPLHAGTFMMMEVMQKYN